MPFVMNNERENYRADATAEAWEATATFLKTCFQGT